MPTKRKRRTRNHIPNISATEWHWLTGESVGDEFNEFELLDLENPIHEKRVIRALELLKAYPKHAETHHPGRTGELEQRLATLREQAERREQKAAED